MINDTDADDFFRQGDEGTYAGGPSDSIPAGVVDVFDDLDEEALPRITREHIERRDRYTRWVKGFVGALAVGVCFAFAARAVQNGTDERTAAAAPLDVSPPPARVSDFHAMTEALAEAEGPGRTTRHAEATVTEAPVAVEQTHEAAPKAAATAQAPVRHGEASRDQVRVRRTNESTPVRALTAPTAPPMVPVGSSPPTANFPP